MLPADCQGDLQRAARGWLSAGRRDAVVTRELKLALIVGFSLVLVVVVLVSDHLSQARKAKLANGPTDPALAVAPLSSGAAGSAGASTPGTAPNSTISGIQPGPLGSFTGSEPTLPPAGGLASNIPVIEPGIGTGVASRQVNTPVSTVDPGAQPAPTVVTLRQGRTDGSTTTEPSLLDEVRARGGDIVNGNIYLPPAANIQAMPVGATSVTTSPLSPAESLSQPPMLREPSRVAGLAMPPVREPAADVSSRTYVVIKGDTAIKIARKLYGDGNAWRKLADANPGIVGKNGEVRLGARLKVPADAKNADSVLPVPSTSKPVVRGVPEVKVASKAAAKPNAAEVVKSDKPSKLAVKEPVASKKGPRIATYTVKKGDTLGVIAQRTLGSSRRVQDIIDANSSVIDDVDSIPAGTVLKIPAQAS